jgi:hypothetical protein
VTKRKPKPRKTKKQPRSPQRLAPRISDDVWTELEAGLNRAVANCRRDAQPLPPVTWP